MRSALLAAAAAATLAAGAPAPPAFSWDTVGHMAFYHSCNYTGPYTDAALQVLAKFPMVTIEKGQQVLQQPEPPFAEDAIVETLRRVKALNPNISTIFYYNSVLDWPFYRLHHEFLRHPEFRVNTTGGAPCRMDGDRTFPNHTGMLAFDFSVPGARDFWMSECVNMTRSGVVDGCFSDRADSGPSCPFDTPEHKAAYEAGHNKVHQDLQKAIGDGVVIANHMFTLPGVSGTHIESFDASEASIQLLNSSAALGKLVQAHAGYNQDGGDDHCSHNVENSLAAFLIGAREHSFFGCSRAWNVGADPVDSVWHPEYDKPLGAPTGLAVKTGDVWRREFASGTVVTFDAKANLGHIAWAAGGVRAGE